MEHYANSTMMYIAVGGIVGSVIRLIRRKKIKPSYQYEEACEDYNVEINKEDFIIFECIGCIIYSVGLMIGMLILDMLTFIWEINLPLLISLYVVVGWSIVYGIAYSMTKKKVFRVNGKRTYL